MEYSGVEWRVRMEYRVLESNRVMYSGLEWSIMEKSGVEWSMEWSGV